MQSARHRLRFGAGGRFQLRAAHAACLPAGVAGGRAAAAAAGQGAPGQGRGAAARIDEVASMVSPDDEEKVRQVVAGVVKGQAFCFLP